MNQLRDESKIWVYQAERPLSGDEITEITPLFKNFCENWTAHNHQLKASFEIIQNRFIVLAVDESLNTASGCSIDKSVAFIKSISDRLGLSLFERMQMAYIHNDELKTVHFNDIQNAFEQGIVHNETLFYNNNVQSLGEYRRSFLSPLKNHWLYSKIKH